MFRLAHSSVCPDFKSMMSLDEEYDPSVLIAETCIDQLGLSVGVQISLELEERCEKPEMRLDGSDRDEGGGELLSRYCKAGLCRRDIER